ncbi:uncharacterized protein LACBIDRAFT_300888 [Laccaria bicolor S238N-H82]|uniref:Predicted protein n=1 Tax=Laccaria bicolor (strain S238N-H82 / ATCC MYA-4686) TaxID=486041 RepID=B0CQT6_LACBS|nr:uncharacterized protein LACBIDRAFT_300888 [Laccaria bicolor S238N-H82]EDR15695.1 predicted protein [Laccaria bicolor S238N-H82]|eukprot:XP_001873903.1 predicted protein [Laccaria bicolor S238N-H82]
MKRRGRSREGIICRRRDETVGGRPRPFIIIGGGSQKTFIKGGRRLLSESAGDY